MKKADPSPDENRLSDGGGGPPTKRTQPSLLTAPISCLHRDIIAKTGGPLTGFSASNPLRGPVQTDSGRLRP